MYFIPLEISIYTLFFTKVKKYQEMSRTYHKRSRSIMRKHSFKPRSRYVLSTIKSFKVVFYSGVHNLDIRYDINVFLGYIRQLRRHSVPSVYKDGIVRLSSPLRFVFSVVLFYPTFRGPGLRIPSNNYPSVAPYFVAYYLAHSIPDLWRSRTTRLRRGSKIPLWVLELHDL